MHTQTPHTHRWDAGTPNRRITGTSSVWFAGREFGCAARHWYPGVGSETDRHRQGRALGEVVVVARDSAGWRQGTRPTGCVQPQHDPAGLDTRRAKKANRRRRSGGNLFRPQQVGIFTAELQNPELNIFSTDDWQSHLSNSARNGHRTNTSFEDRPTGLGPPRSVLPLPWPPLSLGSFVPATWRRRPQHCTRLLCLSRDLVMGGHGCLAVVSPGSESPVAPADPLCLSRSPLPPQLRATPRALPLSFSGHPRVRRAAVIDTCTTRRHEQDTTRGP